MILRERQDRIVSALRSGGAASVRDLAQSLEVSESTIRRDLDLLDRNGELTRTYGGAVLRPGETVTDSGDPLQREDPSPPTPASSSSSGWPSGPPRWCRTTSVVLLDIGTTTPLVARRLRGRPVTVITSNLAVLDELRDDDAVRLVMLGGVFRRNYRSFVGSLTQSALSQVSADLLFLSCTGVRPSGHVVDNMAVEAPIKQAMIAAADRIVLLATEAKFPGTGALAPVRARRCRLRGHHGRRQPEDPRFVPAGRRTGDHRMKLCILGGGGFRTPYVYQALLRDDGSPRITEVALYDIDEDRLPTMTTILEQFAVGFDDAPKLVPTTSLRTAIEGSDFVFAAIRVGGLEGRRCDEHVALDLNVIGQETTGPGGLAYAIRTVPVMMEVARLVQELAPQAYLMNFTNPAGIITEAMQSVLGDRVLGICDTPSGLGRRVARMLGLDHTRVQMDYVGLNHLGWMRRVLYDGRTCCRSCWPTTRCWARWRRPRSSARTGSTPSGVIPNEYLYYYYFNRDAVRRINASGGTRGDFLAADPDRVLRHRPGGGCRCRRAVARDGRRAQRQLHGRGQGRRAGRTRHPSGAGDRSGPPGLRRRRARGDGGHHPERTGHHDLQRAQRHHPRRAARRRRGRGAHHGRCQRRAPADHHPARWTSSG